MINKSLLVHALAIAAADPRFMGPEKVELPRDMVEEVPEATTGPRIKKPIRMTTTAQYNEATTKAQRKKLNRQIKGKKK